MENEQKVVTIGRIFKVAFSNWKILVPVTVGVMVAATLGIHFGFNSYRGKYSSTFSYSSLDLSENKYADGSDFYYRNLISETNLNNVKNSDAKYASINIESILNHNSISIAANQEEGTYTINLSYDQIKDYNLAKSFIKDITESALKKDADIVANGKFDNSLALFDSAETFEEQVKYLFRQAEFLTSNYDTILGQEKTTTPNVNKKSLPIAVKDQATANKEKINVLIDPDDFVTGMNIRIATGGYVKDYNVQEAKNYEIKQKQLGDERSLNQAKIDSLEAEINNITSSVAINSFSEEVEKLVFRNVEIDHEIDAITAKLANKDKAHEDIPGYNEFVADLASYKDRLSASINDYKSVLKAAYLDGAEVTYEDSSIIKLNGTIALYLNIPISLVFGVIVGAVVVLIVDRRKLYE